MGTLVRSTPVTKVEHLPPDDEIEELEEGGAAPADMAAITLKLTSDACGERLDKVVAKLVPQFSRSRLQQWIDAGHVSVDGAPAKSKMTMLGDETIHIAPQSVPEDAAFKPEPMDLHIVHEDKSIIVLDKPAGLVVHPGAGNWSGTLLNGLLHHCPALANVPRA
jgi:23S rRNA pseudouridine1911/1915/1917 synthase